VRRDAAKLTRAGVLLAPVSTRAATITETLSFNLSGFVDAVGTNVFAFFRDYLK
jgi:hypothetical protein